MPILRHLLAALLLLLATATPAATIEGQRFDDRIRLADADLTLNGVGLRAVAWLKGYAAGLYLPQKASTAAAAIAQKGPKRVQLKMMVDVGSEEFQKAWDKGMTRNHSPAEYEPMKERIAKFSAAIAAIGKLKKGDVIDLDFLPGKGLQMSLNGRPRGEIVPGEDLYAGLLKIFVGNVPVDARLKAGLLGVG
jgi:chalcone isomerase-like protein